MFQSGNNHSAVRVIKTFLNSSPKTATNNLKPDNSFDAATNSALAEFQKNKGLNPTGGMDVKTWLAIGAEMNPVQIHLAGMWDRTARDLLQMGYRLKFPFKKRNSDNPSGITGFVQTKSLLTNAAEPYKFTFSVFVVAFAPFDWFGPLNLSRGDGKDRRFGFKLSESYRLRAETTMTASLGSNTFPWSVTRASDATDSYLLVPSIPRGAFGVSIPSVKLIKEKSEGTISSETTGEVQPNGLRQEGSGILYHFHGNDDAFALWGGDSLLTSDIDIHASLYFQYFPQANSKTVLMRASGRILGDQFPAVETFIRDQMGNGVMLGVWQVNEGDGPVFDRYGNPGIIGDKRLPMIDVDVHVTVEDGVFTGVQKFGRIVSLAEHNKQFTDLSPVKWTGVKRSW